MVCESGAVLKLFRQGAYHEIYERYLPLSKSALFYPPSSPSG